MRDETGEWPVLLLDDVMSELDPARREQLIRRLEGVQVVLTCTDASDLAGAPHRKAVCHPRGGSAVRGRRVAIARRLRFDLRWPWPCGRAAFFALCKGTFAFDGFFT